jgi:hypothetical protein
VPDDEAALTADIVRLASQYGRYGYRRIREMLVAEGWRVNRQAHLSDLATGRAESSNEATKTGPPLAQRGVVHAAKTRAAEPRLVL